MTRSTAEASRRHRREIEGLRAVAVLLVVVYHIWLGRVSGGVDVFLMLTGFLITGSLVRMAERDGRLGPGLFGPFLSRLARRLLPTTAVVLLAVLAGTLLFLPRARWQDTIYDVLASCLQYENWRLAVNSVDYLASNVSASPVQHFWSLSIQWQFYLIWPALLITGTLLGRRFGAGPRTAAAVAAGTLFAISLGYSVVMTAIEQRWAYFDTATRLWEFAFGALAFLVLPRLRLGRAVRILMGWIGLAGLLLCGLVLQVSTVFPGYAALWPVTSAMLIIAAGETGSRIGADRLLVLRPVLYAGRISYALYLWHWPILIFYLMVTRHDAPTLNGGLYIVATAAVLAAATTWLAEKITHRERPAFRSFAIGVACLLPPLAIIGGWSSLLAAQEQARAANTAWSDKSRLFPDPADAFEDRPLPYKNGCAQGTEANQGWVKTCRYGAEQPLRRIIIVGDSHAAQWFPAFNEMAEDNQWEIVNMTKGACALSTEPPTYQAAPYPSCVTWREQAMKKIAQLRPDLVVTTASATNAWGKEEQTPSGYLERWRQLDALGIKVLAFRDNPRWPYEPPECVDLRGADECVTMKSDTLAPTPPYAGMDIPDNATILDLTDEWCPEGRCPSVFDNIVAYADRGHFTATFMRYKAPFLEKTIKEALDW